MFRDNLAIVNHKIAAALALRQTAKITGDKVTLVAVTKNHPPLVVTEALEAGLADVGENRVQEAKNKKELLPAGGIWHLLGHLQTNKIKQAVELFDIIESVDSAKVLMHIEHEAAKLNKLQRVLLQINLTREEQKSGLSEEDYQLLRTQLASYPHVRVEGLMVIAKATDKPEETRPTFARGYQLFCQLQEQLGSATCTTLSMGMTHDYWIAIEEGANSVRLGTALFGARDYSIK
ncbi:MAG: YggS family pyridoxal phosphate-dependent enzyme [Acidaminococcaceae bacterium]|nr:YggS family pyridoxal phosphate-dependent enzyme [Acidaminococcaceae bacterium]